MNDRELLELAAKATGWFVTPPKEYAIADDLPVVFTFEGRPWNPLTDDGDALRLAVKLGIQITTGTTSRFAVTVGDFGQILEERLPDPYAATRRSIVRAAAEIGKAIP